MNTPQQFGGCGPGGGAVVVGAPGVDTAGVDSRYQCHMSGVINYSHTFRAQHSKDNRYQQPCIQTKRNTSRIKMFATHEVLMLKTGTQAARAHAKSRATKMVSPVQTTCSMSRQGTPSAGKQCTRPDGVGQWQ